MHVCRTGTTNSLSDAHRLSWTAGNLAVACISLKAEGEVGNVIKERRG